MLFVEMEGCLDLRIVVAQGHGTLGVALHDKANGVIEPHNGKHLAPDLKDERHLIKRKTLLDLGQRQTKLTKINDVHRAKIANTAHTTKDLFR